MRSPSHGAREGSVVAGSRAGRARRPRSHTRSRALDHLGWEGFPGPSSVEQRQRALLFGGERCLYFVQQ